MGITLTEDTRKYGVVIDQLGAHLGCTIMTEELTLLLSACPVHFTKTEYRNAIVDDNGLLKRSSGARIEADRRLVQLYGLDPSFQVFRISRELWEHTSSGHNLVLLFCALTREGAMLGAKDFERTIAENFPGRIGQLYQP